jgi:predicted RND superfamily exporter protein
MPDARGDVTQRVGEAVGRVCLKHRVAVLAILAAVSALAVSQLPQVRFDNAIEIWFLDDDPGLLSHHRLLETFGSDELIFVGVGAPDVFAPEVLEVVDRVTRAVEEAPHVEKVFSLTNIESITGRDGSLEVGELVEFPVDPAELPAIRERALANELYVGNVVSAAGDFTTIIARIPHIRDDFDYKVEAVSAIREILASQPETRFYLTGGPVIDDNLFYLAQVDSVLTTALMIALLVVALAFLLRSASGVVLPLVTVLLGTAWALGWMVLSGTRINSITTMLPPMLLAIGVANAMHILVDYQNRCREGEERDPALRAVYRELTVPCFLTSLTTAIGMLSLLASEMAAIREFGLFAAAGVLGAFLIAIALVPIALSYLPAPRRGAAPPRLLSEGALHRLYRFTLKRGRWIAVASLALFAISAAAATRVKSESAFMEWFRDSNRVKQDTRRIERALAGSLTVEVIVETEEEGGLMDPAVLREIALLQEFLEAQPEAGASQSLVQYLKDMRRAFFDNEQREYRLPETREEAAQPARGRHPRVRDLRPPRGADQRPDHGGLLARCHTHRPPDAGIRRRPVPGRPRGNGNRPRRPLRQDGPLHAAEPHPRLQHRARRDLPGLLRADALGAPRRDRDDPERPPDRDGSRLDGRSRDPARRRHGDGRLDRDRSRRGRHHPLREPRAPAPRPRPAHEPGAGADHRGNGAGPDLHDDRSLRRLRAADVRAGRPDGLLRPPLLGDDLAGAGRQPPAPPRGAAVVRSALPTGRAGLVQPRVPPALPGDWLPAAIDGAVGFLLRHTEPSSAERWVLADHGRRRIARKRYVKLDSEPRSANLRVRPPELPAVVRLRDVQPYRHAVHHRRVRAVYGDGDDHRGRRQLMVTAFGHNSAHGHRLGRQDPTARPDLDLHIAAGRIFAPEMHEHFDTRDRAGCEVFVASFPVERRVVR